MKALPNHSAPQIASAWPNILRVLILVLADAVSHTLLLFSESAAALASAYSPSVDGGNPTHHLVEDDSNAQSTWRQCLPPSPFPFPFPLSPTRALGRHVVSIWR